MDVDKIIAGLHRDMRALLELCRSVWFAAADIGWSLLGTTGNALVGLCKRGLLERRSDPHIRGRSHYRLTPLGLAVRARLMGEG